MALDSALFSFSSENLDNLTKSDATAKNSLWQDNITGQDAAAATLIINMIKMWHMQIADAYILIRGEKVQTRLEEDDTWLLLKLNTWWECTFMEPRGSCQAACDHC